MKTTTIELSAEMVKEKILTSKGNFVKVKWKSSPKPAAAFKSFNLEKITEGVVRAGINFANLSSVKDAIAEGTRGEVQALPWGEWLSFPYIIKHKDVEYFRLYPSNGANHHPKSMFFVDGVEVDKETFAGYLTPSEASKILKPDVENIPECFTVKSSNILGIPIDIV